MGALNQSVDWIVRLNLTTVDHPTDRKNVNPFGVPSSSYSVSKRRLNRLIQSRKLTLCERNSFENSALVLSTRGNSDSEFSHSIQQERTAPNDRVFREPREIHSSSIPVASGSHDDDDHHNIYSIRRRKKEEKEHSPSVRRHLR